MLALTNLLLAMAAGPDAMADTVRSVAKDTATVVSYVSPAVRVTDSLREVPVNIGLAPGMNANGKSPELVRNRFALNLAMNDAGAIDGLDMAFGVARTRQEMHGLQISGGANLVEGNLSGVQLSSVNVVQGSGAGFQASHLVNTVNKDFKGVQTSFVNLVGQELNGVQAGTVNLAGPVRGLQISLVNIGGNVSGAQVGLVNIGRVVHGAQVGLVNISDTLHGAGIGLVNIARNIDLQGDAWVTESGLSNFGLVSGTEHFYMLVGASFDSPERSDVAGWNVGLGGRIRGEQAFGSLDLVSTMLVKDADIERDHERRRRHGMDWDANRLTSVRLATGWRFFRHLEVYGGVSANALASNEAVDDAKYVAPPGDYHWDATKTLRIWPGAFVGVRI